MTPSPLLRELIARARPPAAGLVAQRWMAWARRLVGSHARVLGGGPGLPMSLVTRGGTAHPAQRSSPVEHRLRLAVRVLSAPGPAGAPGRPGSVAAGASTRATAPVVDGPVGGAPTAVPRGRVETAGHLRAAHDLRAPGRTAAAGAAGRPPAAGLAAQAGAATVVRLVEHRRRVEELSRRAGAPVAALAARPAAASAVGHAAGAAGVDPDTGWALPVTAGSPPLVLRPSATARREAPAGPSAEGRTAPGAADPGAAVAVDIERLADQVVRKIDRRIVAHRERMGRI